MTTQKMLSVMRKGVTKYNMIKDGDIIGVGVSGGKDSVTLLKLLAEYRRFSPERFTLYAIAVDLRFDGKDGDYSALKAFCDKHDVPLSIVSTDIGQVVFDVRKEKSPCALCSKMRKGALYDEAVKLGCNKIALGHHADDVTDTFILSLLYEGRLSTFAPKSYLDRTGLTLIRPILLISEADVKAYAKEENLPIAKSRCPADKHTRREDVKDAIQVLSKKVPNIREMIFTAITHPERYSLFDKYENQIDKI